MNWTVSFGELQNGTKGGKLLEHTDKGQEQKNK